MHLWFWLRRFRHDSIPTAIAALQNQTQLYNITFDATEDQTQFNTANLALYDGVVFLSTTDSDDTPRVEVLDAAGKVSRIVCFFVE